MAQINSYTGEVRSAPTTIERTEEGFVVPLEPAVLDALNLDPDEQVILKGTIGDAAFTVEPISAESGKQDS